MLKIVKRAVALVAVLAMALSVAACNKGGTTGGGGILGSTPSVNLVEYTLDSDAILASMPAELKGTKIEFLNWYNPDDREEKEVIDAFEQKSGIEVSYRVVEYGTYVSTVAGLLTVGETPDVLRMRRVDIGLLKLLQPISNTGYDFSHKGWDKHTMDIYTFGEKCYGMALVNTPFFLPTMYFYNKDTIEEMGFENPYELWKKGEWTWAKFEEMCTTWVNQGTEYTGACMWGRPSSTVNAGFTNKQEDDTYTMNITDSLALETWQFAQEGVLGKLYTNLNDGFDQAKQKLLFGSMDASAVQGSSGYFEKTRMRGQLEGVAPPVWTENGYEGEYYLPMMENIAFGIPKAAKNVKAVPYFIAYMANFANYDQSIYDKDSNPNGFFFSEQIKECYLELLTLPNRAGGHADSEAFSYSGEISDWAWMMFFKVDPTQISTFMAENEYIYQNSLNMYNTDIQTLK